MAEGVVPAAFGWFLRCLLSPLPWVKGWGEEKEVSGLEPFFFDEAEALADHKKRLLREAEERRKEELLQLALDRRDRIRDYDPKRGGAYYTRFHFIDFTDFDPDEESPLGPMRYTDRVYGPADTVRLRAAINIFSVKIASLDVKFPIHVYGTVIARDTLDCMCVYLFRRDSDHCQVINSESESLILAGPKRGLVFIDDIYVEMDLKIKGFRWQRDRDLSKGYISIKNTPMLTNEVESKSLETRLSTVEVMYAVVKDAVEATIAIEVLEGKFNGEITACTTSIPDSIVLHDSKVTNQSGGCGRGTIQLLRSVVTVDIRDKLIIFAKNCEGTSEGAIEFTPRTNSWDDDVIRVGAVNMRVKITWSIIDE